MFAIYTSSKKTNKKNRVGLLSEAFSVVWDSEIIYDYAATTDFTSWTHFWVERNILYYVGFTIE